MLLATNDYTGSLRKKTNDGSGEAEALASQETITAEETVPERPLGKQNGTVHPTILSPQRPSSSVGSKTDSAQARSQSNLQPI